jgi:hypothetical protein
MMVMNKLILPLAILSLSPAYGAALIYESFDDLDPAVQADFIARGLNTNFTISNLTCIISPNGSDTATHDPGAGVRFREGIEGTVNDLLVISSFGPDSIDNNYCYRPEDPGTDVTINSGIFACVDNFAGDGEAQAAIQDVQFATIADVTDPTANADTDLILLQIGADASETAPIFSVDFASMVIDGAAPTVAAPADFIGGLSQSENNPFLGWTFGIFEGSRTQPLWFE